MRQTLAKAFFIIFISIVSGQYVTEVYQTCNEEQYRVANCGSGANCFIISQKPTCHCVVDLATGIQLAGNPYKGCTWDLSGNWILNTGEDSAHIHPILSSVTNEEYLFRFDRTDAILATKYITGTVFIVNGITSIAKGLFSRVFLDIFDNTAVLIENAEGFIDQNGRTITLRTRWADTTLVKLEQNIKDKYDLNGDWRRPDGMKVHIINAKKPINWPVKSNIYGHLRSYWFEDSTLISPIRLCTTLFADKTFKNEKKSLQTSSRFAQLGFYGALRFGANKIDIFSPASGYQILSLKKVGINLPPYIPFSLGEVETPPDIYYYENETERYSSYRYNYLSYD